MPLNDLDAVSELSHVPDACVCPLYVCLYLCTGGNSRAALNDFQYSTGIVGVPGNKFFKQIYIIIRSNFELTQRGT